MLSRGRDRNKDQSYALWGVAQEHLARTLLPLGEMTKPEIRALAAEMGHLEVADKQDSYEICFVPDGDYRGWLERRRPGLAERVGGDLVLEASGEVVGQHRGTPFYTVGQRRGLDLAMGEPIYVTRIDAETETVYVGPKSALSGRTVVASDLNWVGASGFDGETRVTAQVRYKDPGAPALVRATGPDSLEVVFAQPRPAPAPGQALVLYDGDDVLAGGWIDAALRDGAPRGAGSTTSGAERGRVRLWRQRPRAGAPRPAMSEMQECPACAMPTPADEPECAVCGYEFPEPKAGLGTMAWIMIGLMLLFAIPLLRWLLA